MYRYEYVEAQAEGFFNSANHREIIDQYIIKIMDSISKIKESIINTLI